MSSTGRRRVPRLVAVAAMALGLAAGSYGIASAASGGSSSGSSSAATAPAISSAVAAPTAAPPNPGNPWGRQRSDETLLTGDTASKVTAAALAKVPGATIVRVETDADGHAKYEAHL